MLKMKLWLFCLILSLVFATPCMAHEATPSDSPEPGGVKSIEDSHDAVDAFLGFARKRLTTFQRNGNDHFNLYLKECEFRFNHRNTDLYQLLLKRFRENPLA